MAGQDLISAIKVLRDRTGAGMMDCKKALEENNNDIEAAIDWLRKKGIAKATSKSTRIAAEGLALIHTCNCDPLTALIVEVNCETDFVSRSDAFKTLVEEIAHRLFKTKPADLEAAVAAVNDLLTDATIKLGEKLDLRRFDLIQKTENQCFGSYIHMGGKIATIVVTDKCDAELNKGLAMHIAAEAPIYIASSEIPEPVRIHETAVQNELALQDPKLKDKNPAMLENIIKNKINAALNEHVLLEQGYLLTDGKIKVGKVLEEQKVKVIHFVRYKVGEGMEKRQDDFAAEVLKQTT